MLKNRIQAWRKEGFGDSHCASERIFSPIMPAKVDLYALTKAKDRMVNLLKKDGIVYFGIR
jgi:hypothetical protein